MPWSRCTTTSPVANWELGEAASGTPLALGALTPNEVHFALGFGSPTVQVVPAEALGMAYARTLAELFPGVELLAGGRAVEAVLTETDLHAASAAGALYLGNALRGLVRVRLGF